MNSLKILSLTLLLMNSTSLFARGGDDVGNGGFAYKQSVIILKMATEALEEKISISTLKDIVDHPERRLLLQNTLSYDDLDKLSKKNQSRGGKKLAMNYILNPPTIIVLRPYFDAFAGKTDTQLDDASLQVQKNLLHEAAHLWGYKEEESEKFAVAFLKNVDEGEKRPTNQIDIKPDFCSCLNGKSDIINDCDSFCSQMPVSSSPILYLNTILGPDITLNPKLGNLYNWCNAQLEGDVTSPQCFLSATDGTNVIENIPVTVSKNSNSLTANIQNLSFNKTYILKLVEGKTGSNAQSRETQLRRVRRSPNPPDQNRALKISSINQYSCLTYGGRENSNGNVERDSYARVFYYFADNEIPPPMPPTHNGRSSIVCHDDQLYPGNDSVLYPRLEIIPGLFTAWDKADMRFRTQSQGKLAINNILEERLFNEYGISMTLDLFRLVSYPNRPSTGSSSNDPLAYIMLPLTDQYTGRSLCPTTTDYHGSDPLLNILGEYMDDTEGLYLAEKEAEIIHDGNIDRIIYGTMFMRETLLKKYGFYVENGLKIRAQENDLHRRLIHYYWPSNDATDPLTQGSRKLFTVRYHDQLNGNIPTGIPTTLRTSDKRIGCIPKGII